MVHVALYRRAAWWQRLDLVPFGALYGALHWQAWRSTDVFTVFFVIPLALCAHVLTYLAARWNVRWECAVAFTRCGAVSESACALVTDDAAGQRALVPVHHSAARGGEAWLAFQRRVFVLDRDGCGGKTWRPLDYPMDRSLDEYTDSMSAGLATPEAVHNARAKWGPNVFQIPEPSFFELFEEHYVAPFFVFQVLCCVLWSLDEYWVYSFFTLVMLLVFEATVCLQRQRSFEMLREMRKPPRGVFVFRQGAWRLTMSDDVVPGDVLSVAATMTAARGRRTLSIGRRDNTGGGDEAVVPCDCVLIRGSCVVNEAMLTGESVPQRKEALARRPEEVLKVDGQHRRSVVFGGTEIMDASFVGDDDAAAAAAPTKNKMNGTTPRKNPDTEESSSEEQQPPPEVNDDGGIIIVAPHEKKTTMMISAPPDGGCVGVAIRTGFETSQGKLMRTILFATERVVGSSETGVFIATLLVFAVIAAAYVLREGLKDPRRNRFKLFLHCVLIVTSVVPPELPMELSLAVTNSLAALSRCGIFCTEPFRIAFAGAIDVCCFDKTGTLTSEELSVAGVSTIEDREPSLETLGEGAERVLAGCHSLALIHRHVVGDSLEKAQLAAIDWALSTTSDALVAPVHGQRRTTTLGGPLRIVQRFAFASELRRMSTLVVEAAPGGTNTTHHAWVLCKGAPEALKPLLKTVPAGFDAAYTTHSRRGFRVLALASKRVQPSDVVAASSSSSSSSGLLRRNSAERDLELQGFLVLRSTLKPQTTRVIRELHTSAHRCVVITGDEVLTAVHVARELGMAREPRCAVLCLVNAEPTWRFVDEAGEPTAPFGGTAREIVDLVDATARDVIVRGDALEVLASKVWRDRHYNGSKDAAGLVLTTLCRRAVVFARVAPDQKELIVATLNAAGLVTLMCGDGTNDVGALKRAHVGVSLAAEPEGGAVIFSPDDDLDGLDDPRLVTLGDASIASPFASKTSTIDCVLAIVRQGRCTLVMMLQVFKILALMCLVTAYMLSSLYLAGVKQGDTQMITVGLATAALFFLASRAEPLRVLDSRRPPRRVFELRPALSIVLHFAVHLTALVKVVDLATPFHAAQDDPTHVPDGPFKPSVINTAVFLLAAVVNINTFATNYCGHPFMQSLLEHTLLHRALVLAYAVLALAASGLSSTLNTALQLVDLPTTQFRADLCKLLAADTAAVWAISFII